MRKLVWLGVLAPLAVFCFMNVACGGYMGWPGRSTDSSESKIVAEVSVLSSNPLESGLWLGYVAYDKTGTKNVMKSGNTYRDGTAPFGVFTSDGNLIQHFNDHVGEKVSSAYDTTGNGNIIFFEDYAPFPDGFCPFYGFAADPDSSDGFSGYCNKGNWAVLIYTTFTEESKGSQPGSKFSNVNPPSDFSPIEMGKLLASSSLTPDRAGLAITVNSLSVGGQTIDLTTPVGVSLFGRGIAIDVTQAGVKEAAAKLAAVFQSMPDGPARVTLGLNGGAASFGVVMAGGPSAAAPLQSIASR